MEDNENKGAHHVTRMCSGERFSPSQPWTLYQASQERQPAQFPPHRKNSKSPTSPCLPKRVPKTSPRPRQTLSMLRCCCGDPRLRCGSPGTIPSAMWWVWGGGSVTVTVYQTGGTAGGVFFFFFTMNQKISSMQ